MRAGDDRWRARVGGGDRGRVGVAGGAGVGAAAAADGDPGAGAALRSARPGRVLAELHPPRRGHGPVYGLLAPGEGVKAAWHHAGPERRPRPPQLRGGRGHRPGHEPLRRDVAPRRRPDAGARHDLSLHHHPDHHFVMERHGPVVVGSPCSGHGFKFTPLIGRVLADLAAGPAVTTDVCAPGGGYCVEKSCGGGRGGGGPAVSNAGKWRPWGGGYCVENVGVAGGSRSRRRSVPRGSLSRARMKA